MDPAHKAAVAVGDHGWGAQGSLTGVEVHQLKRRVPGRPVSTESTRIVSREALFPVTRNSQFQETVRVKPDAKHCQTRSDLRRQR